MGDHALIHSVRIRPGDTDLQGIVHATRYGSFFEAAFVEAFRTVAGSFAFLAQTGVDLVIAEITIRYLSPARFDDLLDVAVWRRHIGTTSLTVVFQGSVASRDAVLATVRYVAFSPGEFRKTPIPAGLREVLERIPAEPADLAARW
ncbi:acyl-CoA thioesterase [Kutzneria kofuensis]|uniref:Acyl-CoA thioester hydrolase n=1 Tax=Kutzneria kofuensis TaxID=103725 RepID=A0A7W9NGP8_9PSEU|nr:thioesterase family protein [Kutzneria kofuensis]MBB5891293.1 acyl-CoA thioester hydrolase [Kutzneria kofuensis]